MQCERDRRPLVLLDAAVVVRLEEAQPAVLIQGDLLDIDAGGIDMRRKDAEAVRLQIARADAEHDNALVAVDEILLVARRERIAEVILGEPLLLRQFDGGSACLALGLGDV